MSEQRRERDRLEGSNDSASLESFGKVFTSVNSHWIVVTPKDAVRRLRRKMLIALRAPNGEMRLGCAEVQSIDEHRGSFELLAMLNTQIVGAAEGDEIVEYELPCTRCECKRCVAGRSLHGQNRRRAARLRCVLTR